MTLVSKAQTPNEFRQEIVIYLERKLKKYSYQISNIKINREQNKKNYTLQDLARVEGLHTECKLTLEFIKDIFVEDKQYEEEKEL